MRGTEEEEKERATFEAGVGVRATAGVSFSSGCSCGVRLHGCRGAAIGVGARAGAIGVGVGGGRGDRAGYVSSLSLCVWFPFHHYGVATAPSLSCPFSSSFSLVLPPLSRAPVRFSHRGTGDGGRLVFVSLPPDFYFHFFYYGVLD